jgi:hypothetical protein
MKSSNESIYALLVRTDSEEKNRSVLETVLYASFILSAVVAIWQFSLQPVTIPAAGLHATRNVACVGQAGGQC